MQRPSHSFLSNTRSEHWITIDDVEQRTVNEIKHALFAGKRPVIGTRWFTFWFSPTVATTGKLPMPFPFEIIGDEEEGHAVMLVGWQDQPDAPGGGYFTFQNSWKSTWGQNGFGLIPYEYFAFPASSVFSSSKPLVSSSILLS